MCGVYGFTFSVDDKKSLLDQMGQLQIHRGPDEDGVYLDEDIALGMRRLSIMDVAHGTQPFYDEQKNIVAFMNGEIYNFRELRSQLESKGVRFQTGCDTEVIPHLFSEFGPECFNLLNGIYVIVIYDLRKRELYLLRDRLGVKPLYYTTKGNDLAFSSELKSLFVLDQIESQPDLHALSAYLELMYVPTPYSPFEKIKKCPEASYLHWTPMSVHLHRYWTPSLATEIMQNEDQVSSNLITQLGESTSMQLQSDVPYGFFLSGGVDSSAVVALASKATDTPLLTYHISWADVAGKRDESASAKVMSDKYQTRHHVKNIQQEDFIHTLPKLIWHLEEPFADAAFIPTYLLAAEASKDVKVILSGAGGDELFGGYPHHVKPSLLKHFILKNLYAKDYKNSWYDQWKSFTSSQWRSLFPWFKDNAGKQMIDEGYAHISSKDYPNANMLYDLKWYLQNDILFMTDKMTMASSIECRVPLLDHRLVEYSLSLHSQLKIKNGTHKHIFKKSLHGLIPDVVLHQPKEGFGLPIQFWMNRYKSSHFDQLLDNGALVESELIHKQTLDAYLKNPSLSQKDAELYWKILILEIWFRLFVHRQKHESIF